MKLTARGRWRASDGTLARARSAVGFPQVALIAGALVLGACGSEASDEPAEGWLEDEGGLAAAPAPYEDFRESSRTTLFGESVYIVEGDIVLPDEAALAEYYESTFVIEERKSIVNLVNGVRDVRSDPVDIRYCFASGWSAMQYDSDGNGTNDATTPSKATVAANLKEAMGAWQGVANVRFVYVSSLDGASCSNSVSPAPAVDFVVRRNTASVCTATGAFPSLPWAQQTLTVPLCGVSRLLAIHELGHILGLRHEHIHSGASPRCQEDFDGDGNFDVEGVAKE